MQLSNLQFPERSQFLNATFRPLYIEPVIGSGERLCIGAVIEWLGNYQFVAVPGFDKLSRIYGKAAKSLEFALELTKEELSDAINPNWSTNIQGSIPVDGVIVGDKRLTAARSYEECVRIVFLQVSSLFRTIGGASVESVIMERRKINRTATRLEKQIQKEVATLRPGLHQYFNQEFHVSKQSRPMKVSFCGSRLVANIGLLVPKDLSRLVDTAKARILDLEKLYHKQVDDLIDSEEERHFQLFMQRVTRYNVEYSEQQIDLIDEAAEELRFLSDKSNVQFAAFETEAKIVEAILEVEPG